MLSLHSYLNILIFAKQNHELFMNDENNFVKKSTLVTDVGSTKVSVIQDYHNACSNPDVKFVLDHKDYYLEPGHGYEINNQLTHEVRNESNIDRIHMIVDLKEWKDDDKPEFYEVDSKKYWSKK